MNAGAARNSHLMQRAAVEVTRSGIRRYSPRHCERCGKRCRGRRSGFAIGKIVAHHEDYAKPLEVTWLCKPCHRLRHLAIARGQLAVLRLVTEMLG